MSKEVWSPVYGYEDYYQVSSFGSVKGIRRKGSSGGLLKPAIKKSGGYPFVQLCKNGLVEVVTIHTIVARAFLGPRPEGYYIRHLDGNPLNNTLANLSYGTPSENSYDTVKHGRHHLASLTECKHGHPFDEENTILKSNGQRQCRECSRRRNREYRARLKSK